MKRPIKPFVVEVRKGQKKSRYADVQQKPAPSEDDSLRRAEAALFGAPAAARAADQAVDTGPARSGRILQSITDEPAPAPVLEPEPEQRRRGRPPGSKNKPREGASADAAPKIPKRRGRPPRMPEGAVRRVALTPELASAALETIARVAAPATTPAADRPAPTRGRPRLVPRALLPALNGSEADPASGALPRRIRVALANAGRDGAADELLEPPAGERWTRRLRGAALTAFERRGKRTLRTSR